MPPSDTTTNKGDAYSRLSTSTSSGRGSLAGWTTCPLCPPKSSKRYALGRGIAAHLHAVHTPWKLGKSELKRREKERVAAQKRRENMGKRSTKNTARKRKRDKEDNDQPAVEDEETSWTPTEEEIDAWGRRVAELTAQVEDDASLAGNETAIDASTQPSPNKRRRLDNNSSRYVPPGRDRTGANAVSSYRKSLPPLLAAAAEGNAEKIQSLMEEEVKNSSSPSLSAVEKNGRIRKLLDQQDRNGSIAEHWAAGGGHLYCLRLLHKYRDMVEASADDKQDDNNANGDDHPVSKSNQRQRRRDGRTSLHFACKNGQDDVITYLLKERGSATKAEVDVPTGDGTTPLHLACFSAHFSTVKLLIERYSADVHRKNDWGCGVAHWIAMSVDPKREGIVEICQYLRMKHNISFHERQKQGHSAVHKAAQKKNREVIEWCDSCMNSSEKEEAGRPDDGGNKPSDVWTSAGGDAKIAGWMLSNGW